MVATTLVLIGPPGSGKTTVGRRVAKLLQVPFTDTDAAIEAAEGRTISDIFVTEGEDYFRQRERELTLRALAEAEGVISLGGGAPMQPAIAAALNGHRVVFLDVGIADAAKRIGLGNSRPLLSVNPRASWIAMMSQRRPSYESLATWTVDSSGDNPKHVAARIVDLVQERP